MQNIPRIWLLLQRSKPPLSLTQVIPVTAHLVSRLPTFALLVLISTDSWTDNAERQLTLLLEAPPLHSR